MSFKITKGRKIQEWLEHTNDRIKTALKGESLPIDLLEALPPQLQKKIWVSFDFKRFVDTYHNYEILALPASERTKKLTEMIIEIVGEENYTQYWNPDHVYPINVETLRNWENLDDFCSWTKEMPFPAILKKYLKFILESLSTLNEDAEDKPINIEERINGHWAGTGWAFKGYIHQIKYKNQLPYSAAQEELLLLEQYDLEQQKFERLERKYKSASIQEESYKRERISEEVRIAVWRRDDGKCARCGNRENLEYDHIVPVSKGGGNTARNIELLCESCNRKKSNKIE